MTHISNGLSPAGRRIRWDDLAKPERIAAIEAGLSAAQTPGQIADGLGTSRAAINGYIERTPKLRDRRNANHRARSRPKNAGPERGSGVPFVSFARQTFVEPPIPFVERQKFQCAWIDDDPSDHQSITDLMCCGQPVDGEGSWCARHRTMVFL